jgi:L-iditol 2-dehydrogenase
VLTGISGNECDALPVGIARRKELTLRWCRRFKHNFPEAIALLGAGKVDAGSLVTHSFPLAAAKTAFDLVAGYQDGVLKASIDL